LQHRALRTRVVSRRISGLRVHRDAQAAVRPPVSQTFLLSDSSVQEMSGPESIHGSGGSGGGGDEELLDQSERGELLAMDSSSAGGANWAKLKRTVIVGGLLALVSIYAHEQIGGMNAKRNSQAVKPLGDVVDHLAQDDDMLANNGHVMIPSQKYMAVICHSQDVTDFVDLRDDQTLLSYIETGEPLPGRDAAEVWYAIGADPAHLPPKAGKCNLKVANGDKVPAYPCRGGGGSGPHTFIQEVKPDGNSRLLKTLTEGDCFRMKDMLKLMDDNDIHVMVMLACKVSSAQDTANTELAGEVCTEAETASTKAWLLEEAGGEQANSRLTTSLSLQGFRWMR